MRLAHKRKVQMKLQKRIKAVAGSKLAAPKVTELETKKAEKVSEKAVEATVKAVDITLTPKQQQVLDIVAKNPEGINPKGIGLEAGQEESKAASWATGALKKLLEESLVEKQQLAGNKVIYKTL